MRPDSFVSLSETIKMKGLISFRPASPGIAAIASFASPSMHPPSEITQKVTRSRFASLSPKANPCATGIPDPNGPLLMKTPSGLRWLSPCPVNLLSIERNFFKSSKVIPSNPYCARSAYTPFSVWPASLTKLYASCHGLLLSENITP